MICFEIEQMCVTRDNEVGPCRQSTRKHVIVIRVSKRAGGDGGRFDNFGQSSVLFQELANGAPCLVDALGKFWS